MALQRINPPDVYEPNRNIYTQVIKTTGTTQVHVAGTVAFDIDKNVVGVGDMKAQTLQVLDNIERSLAAADQSHAKFAI